MSTPTVRFSDGNISDPRIRFDVSIALAMRAGETGRFREGLEHATAAWRAAVEMKDHEALLAAQTVLHPLELMLLTPKSPEKSGAAGRKSDTSS